MNQGKPSDEPEEMTAPAATVLVKSSSGATSADTRVHYLVVVTGEEPGMRVALGPKPIVIGRTAPANVILPDDQVSRSHCRVHRVMGEVFVTDLGSSNGTYIDGERIPKHGELPVGGRLAVGSHVLELELRSREEVEATTELGRDLASASAYIHSLIPPPLASGPVITEWMLQPSTHLGGDVFGYHFIDDQKFALYLIDVSGHGAGAAMHAASVINVLRRKSLPGVDTAEPAQVARYLNEHFNMHTHGGLYLTLWYGVFDLGSRVLSYCSAGHHASYLVPPGRGEARALRTRNISIGIKATVDYVADRTEVPSGSVLYIFSDGVFEIETKSGPRWEIEDLVARIVEPPIAGVPETRRLYDAVRAVSASPSLEDDFSMVVATLP